MQQSDYLQQVRDLSDRLIQLQRPIRILDAIKWPAAVETAFYAAGCRELPAIDRDYYESIPLGFKSQELRPALKSLQQDIDRRLDRDGLGRILAATTEQYLQVLDLLEHRGLPTFGECSRALYGSASDHLHGDRHSLRALGEKLCEIFSLPGAGHLVRPYAKDIPAEKAVQLLQDKLRPYFHDNTVHVMLSDGIISDAAAGGDYIKIKENIRFSDFDLQVLEVHEGWVHVGTTLNGRQQPWASWLSVGSPRITACQEGLAVLMETLTFSSYPQRALKVSDRVVAVDMAEQGANFLEVYRHFINRGLERRAAYQITQRVFRGGMVNGSACFTKDLAYLRGFIENVNFLRSAIQAGVPEIIPMLFVGKVNIDDIPILYEHYLQGHIVAPRYVPPMFRDLNGLYVWFGFSSGMATVNMEAVQKHFKQLFDKLPKISHLYEKVVDYDSDL